MCKPSAQYPERLAELYGEPTMCREGPRLSHTTQRRRKPMRTVYQARAAGFPPSCTASPPPRPPSLMAEGRRTTCFAKTLALWPYSCGFFSLGRAPSSLPFGPRVLMSPSSCLCQEVPRKATHSWKSLPISPAPSTFTHTYSGSWLGVRNTPVVPSQVLYRIGYGHFGWQRRFEITNQTGGSLRRLRPMPGKSI